MSCLFVGRSLSSREEDVSLRRGAYSLVSYTFCRSCTFRLMVVEIRYMQPTSSDINVYARTCLKLPTIRNSILNIAIRRLEAIPIEVNKVFIN